MAQSLAGKVRTCVERGYMLSKRHQDATEAWQDKDGRQVNGRKEADYVLIASSCEESKEFGMTDVTVLEYEVDTETFNNAKFMSTFEVRFEINIGGGRIKAAGAKLIK